MPGPDDYSRRRPWWLRGGHLETIVPVFWPHQAIGRERETEELVVPVARAKKPVW